MRRLGALVSVIAVCFALASLTAGAASAAPSAPVLLHLKFRKIATRVSGAVQSSGDYLGYPPSLPGSSASAFVLVNDKTGKQTTLQPCRSQGSEAPSGVLGYPWVGFDCGGVTRYRIFNIVTHQWHALGCNACQRYPYLVQMTAIGAHWAALTIAPHQSCGDGVHATCGPATTLYENVITGALRTPRPAARTMVDLDSPTLTSRICRPLVVPKGTGAFPSPFWFQGRYALELAISGIYVDRCGSRLHLRLIRGASDTTIFANTQAVGLCNRQPPTGASPTLQGVFLPSLHRFQVNTPSTIGCPQSAALGPHHLAIVSGDSLWLAAFPSTPPSRSRQPSNRTPIRWPSGRCCFHEVWATIRPRSRAHATSALRPRRAQAAT